MKKKRFNDFCIDELKYIESALNYYADNHREDSNFYEYKKLAKEAIYMQIQKIVRGEL